MTTSPQFQQVQFQHARGQNTKSCKTDPSAKQDMSTFWIVFLFLALFVDTHDFESSRSMRYKNKANSPIL
jgi:hypothetical protein